MSFVEFTGTGRLGKRTKQLVKRLGHCHRRTDIDAEAMQV